MAFGRLERPQGSQPMSEINMTPLIDVMLVLLVIFMLTAPLMTSKLKLDLPKSDARPSPDKTPSVLSITLTPDGRVHLDDQPSTMDALTTRTQELARSKPETEVHLRADKEVAYGRVAELIGTLQKAGLNRIAFVTEAAADAPAGAASAP
ncbi:MAG: biopolymer transporter ExbD [Aquabacterium sp.]|uniref:ExbD/TolR family protein n=1 Tax=Aquabacterium sp. TaxID=1872578 RepID=UPI0025BE55D9|nr:biopolymer transporter ExbD [Aquabacterium sp.]MBI5926014.1 biopolymer transporter ExbD [Aquabacterium sp.]